MPVVIVAVVGAKYVNGGAERVAGLSPQEPVELVREPGNPADTNAIAVYIRGIKSGYVPAYRAEALAGEIDAKRPVSAEAYASGKLLIRW